MGKKMLINNTISKVRYFKWTYIEAFAYFLKGAARELNIASSFFLNLFDKISTQQFKKKWLKGSVFNFNGAKLPNISNDPNMMNCLKAIFEDTFLFPCIFNDNYDKSLVEFMDYYMTEGPYGYKDENFDVTIKKGDIVIDAGAWIGDFSAYAASKDAIVYAFEPVKEVFQVLCKTSNLNNNKIHPEQKGLGDCECRVNISIAENNSEANSIILERDIKGEEIEITTLDRYVEENQLERIDFIKADIEGAERNMLKGASRVLKTFAPKLAICTYHLPDDPEVLEKIILKANPNYTVVHLKRKLFAAVIH